MQHWLFCIFPLSLFCKWNFLVKRFREKISHVFLFAFLFHCRSFSPWSWMFGISHSLIAALIFHVFFQRNYKLFIISTSSSFSVIHVSVDIKIPSKKKTRLCCCFLSHPKSPGCHAIYRKNARVIEMQNFTPAYMKGCTYRRFCQNQYFLDS